jgi:hypothetical protein
LDCLLATLYGTNERTNVHRSRTRVKRRGKEREGRKEREGKRGKEREGRKEREGKRGRGGT